MGTTCDHVARDRVRRVRRVLDPGDLLLDHAVMSGTATGDVNARNRAYRQRHKAKGLCPRCSQPAADGKGGLCEGHANQDNARKRMKTSERRAERSATWRPTYCHSCSAQRADGRCPFCEG